MKQIKTYLVAFITIATVAVGCSVMDKAYKKETTITPATATSPAVTNTVLVDRPELTTAVAVGQTLPIPYVGLGASILGLLYTLYRNIRNKQALVSVVTGIEAGRKILQTTPELQAVDAKIKDFLIAHQEIAGTLQTVSSVVNSYTGDTTKP